MSGQKKLKILSLDGGGIRGLSSLEILKRIMYRVGQAMQPPVSNLRPCDYFDLIGGTSTGGIIALMLGRLRMSVEECVFEYANLGEYIFGAQQSFPKEELFDASRLEHAIKEVIKKVLGSDQENAPLLDPLGDDCCKTLVYTLPYEHANSVQPLALRTYVSTYEPARPCTIWQAARATSAAPTFFKPAEFGSPPEKYIDAGLKFNNPSRALKQETGKIWGGLYGNLDHNQDVACFLSIGTGFAEVARFNDALSLQEKISKKFKVPLRAVEVMKAIVSDTETVASDLELDFKDPIYHRLNVEQGLQAVELFEAEKISRILADTTNYINRRSKDITRCVAVMASLPLSYEPLAQRSYNIPTSNLTGAAAEEALKQRLAALRISHQAYMRNAKGIEDSQSYKTSLKRIGLTEVSWLWEPLVQADILDKRGSTQLLSLKQPGEGNQSLHSELADFVQKQIQAFEDLHLAFVSYRRIYHGTELFFGTSSLEYCWVANRLGCISELFGLRHEALRLYKEAAAGRLLHLGPSHKSTVESCERAALLESTLWSMKPWYS